MDAYLGEIKIWPMPRCPVNWHFCDGSSLPMQDYQALYSILGIQYGGDGVNSFNLPDLRGRAPVHMGTGPGTNGTLAPISHPIGQAGGATTVTLAEAQMPAHEHQALATTQAATGNTPGETMLLGTAPSGTNPYMLEAAAGVDFNFSAESLGSAGGNQPHNNVMPSRTMNYIICVAGQYPVRP